MKSDNQRVVGLTGSVATGKTTVTEMFQRLGAAIVDADQLARAVVQPGTKALQEIVRLCGQEILLASGELDRSSLRQRIIADQELREEVNAITHPRILELESAAIKEAAFPLVIVDAALMIESGSYTRFRELILVYVPRDVQLKRLMKREGMTRKAAVAFMDTQMDIEEKKKYATYLVDNSGTVEETAEQVVKLHEILST